MHLAGGRASFADFLKRIDMELKNLVTVIAASCIMREMNNEEVLLQWLEESNLVTANFLQPDGNTLYDINEGEDSVSMRNY